MGTPTLRDLEVVASKEAATPLQNQASSITGPLILIDDPIPCRPSRVYSESVRAFGMVKFPVSP